LKQRQNLSHALWIPLIWLLMLGSRSVSFWFGARSVGDTQLDGSPLDRLVYLFLIVAGLLVLAQRRIQWSQLIADNKWLSIFFLYLGISVLWADYPFVAFKRWFKDAGNIILVLVILSEEDPVEATRAMFLRCAYVLVPLSVLVIKYFPDLSRTYAPWTGAVEYCGVSGSKNMLGSTLILYSIALLWEALELHDDQSGARKRFEKSSCVLFLGMIAWLFLKAHSQTSFACTLLGGGILLAMRLSFIRSRASRIEIYAVTLALLFLLFNSVFDIAGIFVHALGRNLTFTGRTEIWQRVLGVPINPLIGTGYYSFWLDPNRVEKVSEGFFFHLDEAHNGYIETYLNGGLIGAFLLVVLIAFALRKIKRDFLNEGDRFSIVRLAFLAIAVVYNFTEAAFDRQSFVWFALLLAIVGRLRQVTLAQEGRRDQPEPHAVAPLIEGS
jgi:O-antigen ligase